MEFCEEEHKIILNLPISGQCSHFKLPETPENQRFLVFSGGIKWEH